MNPRFVTLLFFTPLTSSLFLLSILLLAGCKGKSDAELKAMIIGSWEVEGVVTKANAHVSGHVDYASTGESTVKAKVSSDTLSFEFESRGSWTVVDSRLVEFFEFTKSSSQSLTLGKKMDSSDKIEKLTSTEMILIDEDGDRYVYRKVGGASAQLGSGSANQSPTASGWPMYGGGPSRNMVSIVTGLPLDADVGKYKQNVAWMAKLGGHSYGAPTVAGGRVFVCTNNDSPRDPRHDGNRGVLMCFDEKTGAFQWQLVCRKLPLNFNSDPGFGLVTAPTVAGNHAYVLTNRGQVMCLDVEGLANGNDGMQDEVALIAAPGPEGKRWRVELSDSDADVIWVYDMIKERAVFPQMITAGSPLVLDGKVYVPTSNGPRLEDSTIPAPDAPSFIVLDADRGTLAAEMAAPLVNPRLLAGSRASPCYADVKGQPTVVFGAGNGCVYGLAPAPAAGAGNHTLLQEYWHYDANPPEYRRDAAGNERRYYEPEERLAPSEVAATPVYHEGLLYVSIGRWYADDQMRGGDAVRGMLSCIDPSGTGDLSGRAVWTFKDISATASTPAIKDGLVYAADMEGVLYCIDAKTGELYWKFETEGETDADVLVADGRIYFGTRAGYLHVLATGKQCKPLNAIEFDSTVTGVVAANGALFVTTVSSLFCLKDGATAP